MILSDEYAHNTTDMNRITFEVPGLVHKESDGYFDVLRGPKKSISVIKNKRN